MASELPGDPCLDRSVVAAAFAYADRLRSTDRDGAAFLEAELALDQGDFATVVEIGLSDPARMDRTNRAVANG